MVDKIKIGIIGLVTLLAAFGGTMYLTQEQIDKTWVCEIDNEKIGVFDRLSDSHKTGYYWKEINGTMKEIEVQCRVGRTWQEWELIESYCERKGKLINELLNPKKESIEYAEVCGRSGCYICKTPINAYSKCEGTIDSVGEIILPK